MIKHIIFDIGGVIIPEESKHVKNKLFKLLGTDEKEFLRRFEKRRYDTSKGKITILQFYKEIIKAKGAEIDAKKVLKINIDMHKKKRIRHKRKCVINLIRSLRKNYTVSCLTNTEIEVVKLHKKVGTYKLFDRCFISTKMGLRKPDPKIFMQALQRLKARPKECVFIDDKAKNVKGAKEVGIHALRYTNFKNLVKDLRTFSVKV